MGASVIGGYADFAKWVAIFNLIASDDPPPPGFVSLQIAYDGGADILLADGKPINIHDSAGFVALNADPGSKKLRTEYTFEATQNGSTTHLINQPIGESKIITLEELDRVNVNYTNNEYIYTLPDDDPETFPNGSQFELLQVGVTGKITLAWPSGVTLNNINGGSLELESAFQRVVVRKIEQNKYTLFTSAPAPAGIFTPQILNSSGVIAVSGQNGLYVGNSSLRHGVVDITNEILVESDNSGDPIILTIATPIPFNFGDFFQALMTGQIAVRKEASNTNSGAGSIINLRAGSGNEIILEFEVAEKNTTYYANFSYKGWIQ